MKFTYTSIFMLIILLISCKSDNRVEPSEEIEAPTVVERSDKLPFACDMMSKEEMLAVLDMDVDLEILDGNRNRKADNTTSCFYRWDDPKYDVSGVMIQVNRNPLPDEIPDFVYESMNNKRWEGERSYDDPNVIFKYEDMEGLDFPVIYNRETYKYYFGVDNTYIVLIVFNYPAPPEQLDAWVKEIAPKVKDRVS